jgi:hypothetical protein
MSFLDCLPQFCALAWQDHLQKLVETDAAVFSAVEESQ